MMRKIGKFEIEVFKHGVELWVGGMPESANAKPTTRAYTELTIDEQLVRIYLLTKDEYDFYVMHECIHAADFILNNIGANMNTNPDDSEIRAYLAEYIYCRVGCILGRCKQQKKVA